VYHFARTQHKASDNSEVHRSLQQCGSSVWNLLLIALLTPRRQSFGRNSACLENFWILGVMLSSTPPYHPPQLLLHLLMVQFPGIPQYDFASILFLICGCPRYSRCEFKSFCSCNFLRTFLLPQDSALFPRTLFSNTEKLFSFSRVRDKISTYRNTITAAVF